MFSSSAITRFSLARALPSVIFFFKVSPVFQSGDILFKVAFSLNLILSALTLRWTVIFLRAACPGCACVFADVIVNL